MFRMVHVGIFYAAHFEPKALEPTMTVLGKDWLRYGINAWLLWTDKPISVINSTLQRVLDPADQFLLVAVNPHEVPGGRLPPWAWEWVNRGRDPVTGNVNFPPPPLITPPTPALPDFSVLNAISKKLGGP